MIHHAWRGLDSDTGRTEVAGRRIAVLGAGANGASIGADLHRAGEDVLLVEQWPAHVEAMRSAGVRVNLPNESTVVPVQTIHFCQVAELRQKFDVVLMLMKAYDSRWAAQLIEPYLEPDGLLVGVQNGMTVDVIADVVGFERTLGCVIEITSMMFEPGVVERHSGPDRSWFAVGALDATTRGREEEVAGLLRNSGTVEVVDDIRATKWMKLVSNATTLVTTALLGLPMVEAAEDAQMRALMLRSGQEALDAATGLGHPVLPIFGLTPADVATRETVVETLLDTLLRGFVMPDSKTTILQDWMKGRRSEVVELNGLVAATHRSFGGRAVVNEAIVETARRIEKGELEPDPLNRDTLLELVAAAEA
jgi:2-dehydropantoate 2-reductase